MNFQQFQDQYTKLKSLYPAVPTHSSKSEQSDYGDYLYLCKNSFYSFDNSTCENTVYIFDSFKSKDCADGDYVIESELCYECVDVLKCYKSTYLNYCTRLTESHYCFDCGDSHHLFGCTHVSFKEYCIYNKQYSKEEYEKQLPALLQQPPEVHLAKLKELMMKFPASTTYVSHAENADYGNHVDFSKNMYLCFDSAHSENSAYLYDAHHIKNSFDLTQSFHCEFCYECVDCASLNNCHHMVNCDTTFDSGYCTDCKGSNHLFGCVGLRNKEFHFLNKPYPKEEYEKLVSELLASLK